MTNVVARIGLYSVALMTNARIGLYSVALMTNVVARIGLYRGALMTNVVARIGLYCCINDTCCCTYRVV